MLSAELSRAEDPELLMLAPFQCHSSPPSKIKTLGTTVMQQNLASTSSSSTGDRRPTYQVSSIKYQVSSIKYQVSSIKYQVSSIKYQVSRFKYQVSSIKYQVASIKYQVSSIKYQVSSIKHQASSIKHQASSIKHQGVYVHYWKCNFPMNHNGCLSVCLSVCRSVCLSTKSPNYSNVIIVNVVFF